MPITLTDTHPPSLADTRDEVTGFLLAYIETQRSQAAMVDHRYERLWQSIHNQIHHGGKRLRPYMCVLAYSAYGGTERAAIIQVAAAWELLHLGLLIHDDIIDRDTVRHNQPNVTGDYLRHYSMIAQPELQRHAADAAALLAGDLVLSAAYQLVLESPLSNDAKILACRHLAQSLYYVGGGELLDSEANFEAIGAIAPHTIAEYKTASYSFIGPLSCGAEMAGADSQELQGLQTYGRNVGIGYQVRDDLLGTFGDSATTGKSTVSDLQEIKRTFVLTEGLDLMNQAQRAAADQLLAKPSLSEAEAEQLRGLLHMSGIEQRLNGRLDAIRDEAAQAVTQLHIGQAYKSALTTLAASALQRSA